MISIPVPGTYRHYKGNHYEVLMIGTHTETQEKLVIYKALYEPFEVWVRPLEMFLETVEVDGVVVPRFKRVAIETA